MIDFDPISKQTFLEQYWQKKTLVIRGALPGNPNPIDADELAGLACEDDVESRIVINNPQKTSDWQLRQGPFDESDFSTLPESHWTLLVQGVDRFVPEVTALLDHFDFIPQWRVDDVMISYASLGGGVGPHYDNYDVFLYQAQGQRRWRLSTQDCHQSNAIEGLDLRIMTKFTVEDELVLSAGDMLYLPPHVAHDGASLSDDCMTYSFGYRSYQAQELWDSFGDYLSEQKLGKKLYRDPNWNQLKATSDVPSDAYKQAREVMLSMLNDDTALQQWFSRFACQLDQQSMQLIAEPLSQEESGDLILFLQTLHNSEGLLRDPCCRMAYHYEGDKLNLFINGYSWDISGVSDETVILIANHRFVSNRQLAKVFESHANQSFVYELWKQQYVVLK